MREFEVNKNYIMERYWSEIRFNLGIAVMVFILFGSNILSFKTLIITLSAQSLIILSVFLYIAKAKSVCFTFDKEKNYFIIKGVSLFHSHLIIKPEQIETLHVISDVYERSLTLKILYRIENRNILDNLLDRYFQKYEIELDMKESKNIEYNLNILGIETDKISDERYARE